MKKLFFISFFIFFTSFVIAQNKGTIDVTFGDNGRIISPISGKSNGGLLHLDDKIISASSAFENFTINQYFANGNINNQWGQGGELSINLNNTLIDDTIRLLAVRNLYIQADGKLLLTALFENENNNHVLGGLIRYLPEGLIDSSFGNNGFVIQKKEPQIVLPHLIFNISTVVNQRILTFGKDNITDLVIYAFNLNTGVIDSSWGNNGVVRHNFDYINSTISTPIDIVIMDDSRIILPYKDLLFCFLPNGSLDTTFANNTGYIDPIFASEKESDGFLYYNNTQNKTLEVEKQSGNKILVAGKASQYSVNKGYNIVERYLPNGQIDSAFADNGVLTVNFSTDTLTQNHFSNFIVEENDSFIVAGNVIDTATGEGYFAMRRYAPNGKIDSLFGDTGLVVTNHFIENDSVDFLKNILVQSDGKIILTGSSTMEINNDTIINYLMIRYNGANYKQETSITNEIDNIKFNIYPNPANNLIHVDFQLEKQLNINIDLLNLQGKNVFTLLNDKSVKGEKHHTFNLPDNISNGLYFLQVNSNKSSQVKLIQILK